MAPEHATLTVGDWLALFGLLLLIVTGMGGIIWGLLQAQIKRAEASATSAHRRVDDRVADITAIKLDLASNYVRRDQLKEDLDNFARAYILPMTDRLERTEVLTHRIADKLQVPRSDL